MLLAALGFYIVGVGAIDDPKKHKDTFLFSYFCVTKRRVQGGEATSERRRRDGVYQKSARRTCAVLLPNHRRRARVSRASRAWRVRAAKDKAKIGSFVALHGFVYTTRANIAHEKAEQIRARITCTPAYIGVAGVGGVCAPTGLQ